MAQTIFKRGIAQKLRNLILPKPRFKEPYCRLCLACSGSQFKDLFSPFNTTQSIVDVIEEFAKVSILEEDEHSKLICFGCFIKLTASQNFKYLIQNSDFKLRNQLTTCEDPLEADTVGDGNNGNEGRSCQNVAGAHFKKRLGSVLTNSANTDERAELVDDSGDENNSIDSSDLSGNEENDSENIGDDDEEEEDDDDDEEDETGETQSIKSIEIKTEILQDFNEEQNADESLNKEADPVDLQAKSGLEIVKIEKPPEIDWEKIINPKLRPKKKKKRIKKKYCLKCPDCDKVFKHHQDRKRHSYSHTGVYPFNCSVCNKGFGYRTELKAHEVTHSEERSYQCEICGKGFKQAACLTTHRKIHLDEKPYKCDQCDKAFRLKRSLQMHVAVHSPDGEMTNVFCEKCSKPFKTIFHLQNHMRKCHLPRKRVPCHICGKAVPNYSEHIKTHTKPFKCTVCNQSFGSTAILKAHLSVHTGEKLYECDVCNKAFRFSGSLHTHKKIHDLTKRLQCELCDKQFVYKHHLKGHQEKVHQKFHG